HPFGVFVFGAELAVAVWLWRLRSLPLALLALPLVLPYLRLPGRYHPQAGMSAPGAGPPAARGAPRRWGGGLPAFRGAGAGGGVGLAVFAVLAAVGAWSLPRTFAALGLLLVAAPPALLAASGEKLSPRHLIFVLPVWTTFVGAGLSRMPVRAVAVAGALGIAVLAPAAVADPRTSTADPSTAAAWVREHLRPGDALYPYSPVFLAALPRTALALPREPIPLERIPRRTREIRRPVVAIPNGSSWSLIVVPGPFSDVPQALARAAPHLHGIARAAALQLYATSTEGTSPHSSSSR